MQTMVAPVTESPAPAPRRETAPIASPPRALPLSLLMVGFAAVAILLLDVALIALPGTDHQEVAIYHTYRFFTFQADVDSWEPMELAWRHMNDGGGHVYDQVFFDGFAPKFQYPVTSVLPFELIDATTSGNLSYTPLDIASWIAVWATCIFSALIFDRALATFAPAYADVVLGERLLRGTVVVALALATFPVVRAFSLGQAQAWINGLFAALLWLWLTNRKTAAGIAGGLICVVKPQLGMLLLWSAIRRQWGFAAALAATAGVLLVVSLALYGVSNHTQYVDVLSHISRRGDAFYANQSVNGFLNRLLDNDRADVFDPTAYAPYDPIVYVGTLLTSSVIIATALFWRPARHGAAAIFDLCFASIAFTMASPLAWDDHYGILMPIYALTLPAMLRWPVFGRSSLPFLAVSFLLTCNFYDFTVALADHPWVTPIESGVLLGALMLMAALFQLRRAAANEEAVDFDTAPRQLTAASA